MANTVKLYYSIRYENSTTGQKDPIGSLNEPLSFTAAGDTLIDNTFSVATANTKEILRCGTSAGDDIASFGFLLILSTQDVLVEFQGGSAANNSNLKAKANKPLILYSDDTLAYNASGGFAGGAADINKITISNSSGSTASVRILAVL